jgi:cGMP-dependent protein kinase
MEKEMKAPWVPPKEKIISDADIRKMENLGKLVLTEVQVRTDDLS